MIRILVRLARRWRLHRFRLLPLLATIKAGEIHLARAYRRPLGRPRVRLLDWGKGIRVVVPERGGVALLAQSLARLDEARRRLDEPSEIVVVVNGSPPADYAGLAAAYPDIRWQYHDRPLGFTRAVLCGLADARMGAVYLLNNDMLLEPDALAALLPVRAPHVFSIASQVFFEAGRRREETGWTRMVVEDDLPNPRHEVPAGEVLRGTVWAGAGSSLFHAGLLKQLMPGSLAFDPFYWEDVDLGLRAWRMGYDNLVCPASRVLHKHRVTIGRFYKTGEVARIFERNRVQVHLRNPMPYAYQEQVWNRLMALDARSLRELGSARACARLGRARRRAANAPFAFMDYDTMAAQVASPRSARPAVLVVSPFAIHPARHGGAVRTLRLAEQLARDYSVILLSDERELYPDTAALVGAPFASVHLVGRRPLLPPEQAGDRVARIGNHGHRALCCELQRLVETRRPRAVLVEHMELGALVDVPLSHRPAFVLTLQDVLLQPDDPGQREADRFEIDLMQRFDGLVVSSEEDRLLLGGLPSMLVINGVDPASADAYTPSRGQRGLLFVGPFRAPINFDGICTFLREVYPAVRAEVPGVSLTIIGGAGARAAVARMSCFQQPAVAVKEQVDDIDREIRDHALTINPLATLRGSSLKVVESLAAGRACVSTAAGARGRLAAGFPGLIAVPRIADMADPIVRLLSDDDGRVAIERPEPAKLQPCSWEAAGDVLRRYVAKVIAAT